MTFRFDHASVGVLLLISLTTAQSTEFHVSTKGNDSNRGTQSVAFRKIQHAADLAQPSDVITVHEGVYPIRFEAESADLFGNAQVEKDTSASGGSVVVGLGTIGAGLKFVNLPAAGKLAVRYATKSYGTFSLYLNGSFVRKSTSTPAGHCMNFISTPLLTCRFPPIRRSCCSTTPETPTGISTAS